jgi:hypothetical protein
MQFDYSLTSMLPFARAALTVASNFDFKDFVNNLFVELEKVQVRGVERNPPHASGLYKFNYGTMTWPPVLQQAAVEVFCHLLHRGYVVTEGQSFPSTLGGGSYRRTSRGESWANGAEPIPEDVQGYMAHLLATVPSLDSIIRQYVEEGLGSFQRGSFLSAAVMLGAASEKEIYLLGASLANALKDATAQTELTNRLNGRSLYRLLESISQRVAACKKPQDIFDGAQTHLLSLFESIRVQRNDAVHPNTANVVEETVRLSYDAFPRAVKKAEALRKCSMTILDQCSGHSASSHSMCIGHVVQDQSPIIFCRSTISCRP